MGRRLILMRHAKSAWDTNAPSDHARPLNARGRRDAPRIAEALSERGWRPDLVLSSDAQRTRETLEGMESTLGAPPVEYLADLYHGDLADIEDAVASVDAGVGTLLVLGHNPGWEDAASTLAGIALTMTTANAAMLEIDAQSWGEAIRLRGEWDLVEFLRPKAL